MLQSIKKSLKNNKVIVGNIFSLGTLQIFNYILPLITLPYITRVVGPENYGIVAFAGAFVAYFLIFVNYGFNLTATRDISIHREDINKVSEIFWNIICIKSLLGVIALLVSFLLIFTFDVFSEHYLVFLFSLIAIFGEILFPSFLFQGMEKMKYITIINVIIRVLFLIPIFLLVRVADDYIWLPLIASLSSITIGVIAFFIALKTFRVRFLFPTFSSIKYNLIEGWYVFVSVTSYGIYSASTIFILGLLTNHTIVGYYASADRVLQSIKSLIGIFSQAIFPGISKKVIESKDQAIKFLQKVAIISVVISTIVGLLLFQLADFIVMFLFGLDFIEAVIILRILALTLFVYGYNDTGGILTLLNFGYKEEFQKIMILRTIFFIVLGIILGYYLGAIGVALGVLLSEIFIALLFWNELQKKGINLLSIQN